MNETLNSIAHRYTCRTYDGKLPEKVKLEAIALAAVQSPSAYNRQPWQIVVVTDKDFIKEMDNEGMKIISEMEDKTLYNRLMERGGTLYYNAPCVFFILKQPETDLECGIVSENIVLAAASLGLGSTICALAHMPLLGAGGDFFKKRLGISEEWQFGIAVLIGHAADDSGTAHKPDTSKIHFIE